MLYYKEQIFVCKVWKKKKKRIGKYVIQCYDKKGYRFSRITLKRKRDIDYREETR